MSISSLQNHIPSFLVQNLMICTFLVQNLMIFGVSKEFPSASQRAWEGPKLPFTSAEKSLFNHQDWSKKRLFALDSSIFSILEDITCYLYVLLALLQISKDLLLSIRSYRTPWQLVWKLSPTLFKNGDLFLSYISILNFHLLVLPVPLSWA